MRRARWVRLGRVAAVLFFGVVAVTGTAYLQLGHWSVLSLAASVPVGLLTTNILVINNLRDLPTDRAAGKRTLAVRLGDRATRDSVAIVLQPMDLGRLCRGPRRHVEARRMAVAAQHPAVALRLAKGIAELRRLGMRADVIFCDRFLDASTQPGGRQALATTGADA